MNRWTAERVAKRPVRCTNPWNWIWCQGGVDTGGRFVIVLEADGSTSGRAVAFLCLECANHGRDKL